jgi:hypothetical protein
MIKEVEVYEKTLVYTANEFLVVNGMVFFGAVLFTFVSPSAQSPVAKSSVTHFLSESSDVPRPLGSVHAISIIKD